MDVEEYSDDIILAGVDYIGGKNLQSELAESINRFEPDTVALALCEKRFETLEGKKDWLEKPLLTSYKEGESVNLMYQVFIDALMENLRKFKKIEPETHIAELVDVADFLDLNTEFIDRDVTVTLRSAFRSMPITEKFKMAWYFKSAMLSFSDKKRSKSVEEVKKHDDLVGGVLSRLDQFSPKIAEKVKDERIEYMSKKIYRFSKQGKVLAIIPRSKIAPIVKKLEELKREEEREGEVSGHAHLESVGKKIYRKMLRYASPLFFITLAIYLFFFSNVLNIWTAWLYWFLAVGGMASIGALLGRGHIVSILVSFFLAPFMSLTLIGPGWIAGYVEARVRKPKIKDVQDLMASESFNDILSNNLIRPITVGIFSNVLTWVGLFVVLPILISLH